MIDLLLSRLEQNPEARFSEFELTQRSQAVFDQFCVARILETLPLDLPALVRTTDDGRMLDAVDNVDALELFDPEDVEFGPIPVDVRSLRQWVVNLDRLTERLRRANHFSGPSGLLAPRIVLLGISSDGSTAVLALFPNWKLARPHLEALPAVVGARSECVVCLPSTLPPVAEYSRLSARGIRLATLDDQGCVVRLDGPTAARVTSRSGRPRGKGLGALLDCWIACHHLAAPFLSPHDFYAAVERHLRTHPEVFEPLPPVQRFSALRSNGKRERAAAGRCLWHMHATPPHSPI